MSLETLIGEEETKKLAGKTFSIDPNESYDRKKFVKRIATLSDLQDHYSELVKNVNNMSALNDVIGDLAEYAPGDPGENAALWTENPHLAISEAESVLSSAEPAMARYVENKRQTLLNMLSGEALYQLFAQTPSYKTGNPEYDRIRDLKDKMIRLEQAEKEGKESDIGAVVQKELNDLLKKVNPEQRAYIESNPHLVIPSLQKAIIGKIRDAFDKLFKTEKGEIDKDALISYLIANYDAVEDEMLYAPNQKEAYKLWDKSLKPLYLQLAKTLQDQEEKAQKMEDDPEKEIWKKRIKSKGMRT